MSESQLGQVCTTRSFGRTYISNTLSYYSIVDALKNGSCATKKFNVQTPMTLDLFLWCQFRKEFGGHIFDCQYWENFVISLNKILLQ